MGQSFENGKVRLESSLGYISPALNLLFFICFIEQEESTGRDIVGGLLWPYDGLICNGHLLLYLRSSEALDDT